MCDSFRRLELAFYYCLNFSLKLIKFYRSHVKKQNGYRFSGTLCINNSSVVGYRLSAEWERVIGVTATADSLGPVLVRYLTNGRTGGVELVAH